MSMSLALQYAQEWFREKYNWKVNQCGVEFNSIPAYDSGSFFVSIDDGGVETGQPSTESLKETLNLNIGVWRRKEHLMKDRVAQLSMKTDKYLIGSWTLAELERKVILNKFFGLHKNYAFMTALNERWNLPHEENGAEFRFPFYYRGRSGMVSIPAPGAKNPEDVFFGYILKFGGLSREQKLHNPAYALG